MDNKDLMTTNECGKYLNMCVQTLARWRMEKKGPKYFKLGEGKNSRVFYKAQDVDEWVESKRCNVGNVSDIDFSND